MTGPPSRRAAPPLAPILIVLGLLGPMHLSASWNSIENVIPQEPLFNRLDFHRLSTTTSSNDPAPLIQAPPEPLMKITRRYQKSDLGNISISIMAEYERLSPKTSFDPLDSPVFETISKKKVLFLTQNLGSGKVQHVFLDGLQRSDYIDLVNVVSLNVTSTYVDYGEDLWIDDSPSPECWNEALLRYATQQQLPNITRHVPILQLDNKDFPMLQTCSKLIPVVGGKHNIRYAKRSIVQGRQFNWTTRWVDHGFYSNNTGRELTGGPILHSPYTVRTDHVVALARILAGTKFSSPVDYEPKQWDVAHFWRKGNYPVSHLRNQIADVCKDLDETVLPSGRKLKAYCKIVGNRGTAGRRSVNEQYLIKLLKSRIVIVTQRDQWEDHYRLMEALAGGVMVVADMMLSLPKGLVDRESVVLFRSKKELHDVITYYVDHENERRRIAQKGWEIAMGRHRSWHRMEELLFGQPLTDIDNPYGPYRKEALVWSSLVPNM